MRGIIKKPIKLLTTAALTLAVFLCTIASASALEVTLVTDANGAKFEDLPVGDYDVVVSKDGYYSKQVRP